MDNKQKHTVFLVITSRGKRILISTLHSEILLKTFFLFFAFVIKGLRKKKGAKLPSFIWFQQRRQVTV